MKPIERSKLVWMVVQANTNAGATPRFGLVKQLVGKRITGIEFYPATMLTNTPDQVPVIAVTDAIKATLVLKEGSVERVLDSPIVTFFPVTNCGIWKEFVPFVVNWASSFVRFTGVPVATAFSVPFNVFYLDK